MRLGVPRLRRGGGGGEQAEGDAALPAAGALASARRGVHAVDNRE